MGLNDDVPGHKEPKSTSIYGHWILSAPDSTAFAGASLVELQLQPAQFKISARYPGERTPMVVSGTAYVDSTGLLTLTPTSGSQRSGGHGFLTMSVGTPVSLIASAAGGTLLFKPPHEDADPSPSSIWYKKGASVDAGRVKQTSTGEVEPIAKKP